MELKEAIQDLKDMKSIEYVPEYKTKIIDTVLSYVENSIPKQVIEYTLEQIRIEHNSRLEKCETKEEKDVVIAEYNSMRCILEDILEGE